MDSSPIASGFVGSLIAGLSTGLGALPIFFSKGFSKSAQRTMLALSGGMMLGATFFSLLTPALDLVFARGGSKFFAVSVVGGGLVLGAVVLWTVHRVIPHRHYVTMNRNWLFILAIVLHNIPEGLSVGVAYGDVSARTGHTVMLAIAAQNVPEGLAVAASLMDGSVSRMRAFVVALMSGLVEPMGGLVGAFAVSASAELLPWGLAFAAGAMLFVIAGDVLPETHSEGRGRSITFAVIFGFVAMMALAVILG